MKLTKQTILALENLPHDSIILINGRSSYEDFIRKTFGPYNKNDNITAFLGRRNQWPIFWSNTNLQTLLDRSNFVETLKGVLKNIK